MDIVFESLVMAAKASRYSCGGTVPDRPARSCSAGRTGVVAAGRDGEAGGDSEGDGEPKSIKRGKPFTLAGLLDVRSATVCGGACSTVLS